MNSDLQTQTSQEEAELGLHLGHQDYSHPLHSHPGYTTQVSLLTSQSTRPVSSSQGLTQS